MDPRDKAWNLFFFPQLLLLSNRLCPECSVEEHHTHCYCCDTTLHRDSLSWMATPLFSNTVYDNEDKAYSTIRLCCIPCHKRVLSSNAVICSTERGRNPENSLALKERIRTQEQGELIYRDLYITWLRQYLALQGQKEDILRSSYFLSHPFSSADIRVVSPPEEIVTSSTRCCVIL